MLRKLKSAHAISCADPQAAVETAFKRNPIRIDPGFKKLVDSSGPSTAEK